MRLIFLGTSSGTPTPRRNLSASLIDLESEILLFDCGEGTQMQLKKADLRLTKISRIFITHMHGDHVNGLMGLLMSMETDGRHEPLDIFGPPQIPRMIGALAKFLRTNVSFVIRYWDNEPGTLCETDLYRVDCRAVDHRVPCHGFSVTEQTKPGRFDLDEAKRLGIPPGPLFGQLQRGQAVTLDDGRVIQPEQVLGTPRPGRKAAIVMDTRMCEAGVDLARNADVLVHEATFGDDLVEKAHETGHSTARQAAFVAKEANAKRLILTHFSTRYFLDKDLVAQAQEVFPATIAARDFLAVTLPPRDEPDSEVETVVLYEERRRS